MQWSSMAEKMFEFPSMVEVFVITESIGNLNWMMNYIVNMNKTNYSTSLL